MLAAERQRWRQEAGSYCFRTRIRKGLYRVLRSVLLLGDACDATKERGEYRSVQTPDGLHLDLRFAPN